MNAVVMEIRDGQAAVLTDDGQFLKVKDQSYDVGMTITLDEPKQKPSENNIIRIRSFAYAAAAALLITLGVKDFMTPYSVISLDVNPSIEMSVNRYDIVLDVAAINEDAEALVSELEENGMRYKSVDKVVRTAINQVAEGDYEAEDGTTYVVLSAESKNESKAEKLAEKLESIGQETPSVSASAIAADEELLERAHENGTTAGKMYLVDRLKDVSGNDEMDEETWLKKPVREILEETDRRTQEPEENPEQETPEEQMPVCDIDPVKSEPETAEEMSTPEEPEQNPIPATMNEPDPSAPDMPDEQARSRPEENRTSPGNNPGGDERNPGGQVPAENGPQI